MQTHQHMVFSTAMRLIANPAEAEDIAQETFLRAYDHFDELRDNPKAGGWLRTVTTNLSLNHLSRYRWRWSFFSELFHRAGDDEEATELEFPGSHSVRDEVDRAERCGLVDRALQSLPAAQRVPLVLYHLQDLSYEEIAARTGVSLGKVKTDIFRGREALRRKLGLKLKSEFAGDELP